MASDYLPLSQTRTPVVLDTDIGADCDDVGALALLISYAREYHFPILGVCNCSSSAAGNGAIDAVARYCGAPVAALGQWDKPGLLDSAECHTYTDRLAQHFSEDFRRGTLSVEAAVPFYRRLLASAADGSVTLISIGTLNDIAALLDSVPDGISPLTGFELTARKVRALVGMAASYPQGREYNIVQDAASARRVLTDFPAPVYLSDFRLGITFHVGFDGPSDAPAMQNNPIYKAFELCTRGICHKCGFDLTAVQFATLGEGEYYTLTKPGRLEFYEEVAGVCDATRFVPDPAGNIRFLQKKATDAAIAAELNRRIRAF